MKKPRNIPYHEAPEESPIPEYWDDGPIRYQEPYEDEKFSLEEIPTIDGQPTTVDYLDQNPLEGFVISGPLGDGLGRGRHFNTIPELLTWAGRRYPGARVVNQTKGEHRWILRVIRPTPTLKTP